MKRLLLLLLFVLLAPQADEWVEFTVKAPDGVVTPALLRRPSGSGPFPVVVFFHGAPGAQGSEALRRIATEGAGAIRWQRLIEEGIAVCIADYRGHPPNMPFEVLRGEVNAADDALAVVRYLRGQPFIEDSRVGLIGGSLGGAIVLAAMQRDSVAAIALNAPATFPFLGFRGGQLPQDCTLALPDSAIDRSGALERIGLIRSPALIVQGTADTLCSLNRKLHELMIGAGKDASLKLYEGQPHGFTNGPDSPAFRQALEDTIAFFKPRLQPAAGVVSVASAASFSASAVAPESIATAFGSALATTTEAATTINLPDRLGGTQVEINDSAGNRALAPLFFVSPNQVNFLVPARAAAGSATLRITSGSGAVSSGTVSIATVAPGLFSANASGQGVAAAVALRVKAGGTQSYEPIARFDVAQDKFVAVPIDLGPETDQVFLILFGTGIRFRSSLSAVTAKLGGPNGVDAQATFAGAQDSFVGLDQVNARIPRSLAGRGEVDAALTIDGQAASTVKININ